MLQLGFPSIPSSTLAAIDVLHREARGRRREVGGRVGGSTTVEIVELSTDEASCVV